MNRWRGFPVIVVFSAACLLGQVGCQSTPKDVPDHARLRQRALRVLKAGLSYKHNGVVRAQAIEALQECEPGYAIAWIRESTRDPEPGVRFAACMALGSMRDQRSRQLLVTRVEDQDPSVRVAAIFAVHMLGDHRFTSQLADMLLSHHDPAVRCNAAFALGRMGQKQSVRLLRRTENDKDDRVRMQAIEAEARLGDERAIKQLVNMVHSRSGTEQAFAVLALGQAAESRAAGPLLLKLEHGPHLETRLAAARALGMLGSPAGYEFALEYLKWRKTGPVKSGQAPPGVQTLRARTGAAMALGAIGNPQALPHLYHPMENDPDPRLQIVYARAILEILNRHRKKPLPATQNPVAKRNLPPWTGRP